MYSGGRASGDSARPYLCCLLVSSGFFGWHGQPEGYLISRSVIVVNRRSCCLVKTDMSEGLYSGDDEEWGELSEVMELRDEVDILGLRYFLHERDLSVWVI